MREKKPESKRPDRRRRSRGGGAVEERPGGNVRYDVQKLQQAIVAVLRRFRQEGKR